MVTAQAAIPTLLIVSLALGTLTQLQDIAQHTSDKAIKFADDANNAVDCAFTAQPLSDCSPDLFSTDFKAEAAQTNAILADLQSQQDGARLAH